MYMIYRWFYLFWLYGLRNLKLMWYKYQWFQSWIKQKYNYQINNFNFVIFSILTHSRPKKFHICNTFCVSKWAKLNYFLKTFGLNSGTNTWEFLLMLDFLVICCFILTNSPHSNRRTVFRTFIGVRQLSQMQ